MTFQMFSCIGWLFIHITERLVCIHNTLADSSFIFAAAVLLVSFDVFGFSENVKRVGWSVMEPRGNVGV